MSENSRYYRVNTDEGALAALRSNVYSVKQSIKEKTFDVADPGPEVVLYLINAAGWSQKFVASMLKVDVSTVRRWSADNKQRQFTKIPQAQWMLLLIFSGSITISEAEIPIQSCA